MFLRLFGAVAAVGAALIVLAVGAGSTLWSALLLVPAGIAQAVTGVAALRQQTWAVKPAGVLLLVAPVFIWLGSLLFQQTGIVALPMFTATLLSTGAAVSLILTSRHPLPFQQTEQGGVFLGVLLVISAVVAGLVTPALAGTNAGAYATPHGHQLVTSDHGH